MKEGGTLIFSTPNIAHFKARIAFLLSGYPEMYGPLSIENMNAGRVCGHIMPLSYNNFRYGLRKAGFADIEFHVDRLKKGALLSAIPVYPLLAYSRYRTGKRLMRYDQQVFSENESAIPVMNSLKMLASRSCILVARKPKTLTTRPG